MRSATRLPSAALALARLFSAIEVFSLTSTICSCLREIRAALFRILQSKLQLLDLVFEKRLGVGVGLEALVEIGGDEGVGVARWRCAARAAGRDRSS